MQGLVIIDSVAKRFADLRDKGFSVTGSLGRGKRGGEEARRGQCYLPPLEFVCSAGEAAGSGDPEIWHLGAQDIPGVASWGGRQEGRGTRA